MVMMMMAVMVPVAAVDGSPADLLATAVDAATVPAIAEMIAAVVAAATMGECDAPCCKQQCERIAGKMIQGCPCD